MARKVNCPCGRSFHIGHSADNVQCRGCGRTFSGQELGLLGSIVTVALGGELAGTQKKKGNRKPSKNKSHKGKQTGKKPPTPSPLASVAKLFFGKSR